MSDFSSAGRRIQNPTYKEIATSRPVGIRNDGFVPPLLFPPGNRGEVIAVPMDGAGVLYSRLRALTTYYLLQ